MHSLAELPHHVRVLGRTKVQAVGHRDRCGTGDSNIPVRLRQRQPRARVGVKLGVASRGVGRHGDTAAGGFVNTQHTGIRVLRQHRVTAHIAVILLGNKRTRTQGRRTHHAQKRLTQVSGLLDALELLQFILPRGPCPGTLVHRALMGDGVRRGVNNHLAAMGNHQVVVVRDLADLRAGDIPVGANLRELFHIVRGDHRAHAFLRLRGQNLGGRHILRAQRHHIQVHQHAAVTSCGEFRRRAGQSRAAKILDAHHNTSLVQVKAALNEHLLRKRISHLHCGQLAFGPLLKRVRGQHRHTADAVQTRAGTKEHHLIAQARGKR